jgi:GMP synthase-like glutamine amidotransferase
MHLHFLQHADYEGIGTLAEWARMRNFTVSGTPLYRPSPVFPALEGVDLLVVMGGPMSVHDTNDHPWLVQEKHYIARALEKGTRILGICLGAQLVAEALGAQVVRNWQKEIGFHPIQWTQEGRLKPYLSGFNERQYVFHWHGETFSLPEGAVHLARSDACPNQAFAYGDRVLGLQFHMEVGEEDIARFCEEGRAELAQGGQWVQPSHQILPRAAELARPMQYWFWKMLDEWLA